MRNIGARIKALRQEKGITLPALATKTGLSKGLISKIENNKDANPSLETLNKFADALDLTLAELLERERVQAIRIVPETPPNWLQPLVDGLKAEGRAINDDYLQALYVLQHRKRNANLRDEDWRWLYESIEKSFGRG